MILDTCQKAAHYPLGEAWAKAFEFIHTLTPETADGRYEIDGEKIYASVMSYTTKLPEEGKFEAHQKYADIQVILIGTERIDVTDTVPLLISEPYLKDKDLVFFATPEQASSQIILQAGDFAYFLPQDAHMPMLAVDAPQQIKKAVIKVAISALP